MKDFETEETVPSETVGDLHMTGVKFVGTPEQITKLFAAFAKAQAEAGIVMKDATNEKFGNYASLPSYIETLREPFRANGLFHIEPPLDGPDSSRIYIQGIIGHEAGGHFTATASIPKAKGTAATNDQQVHGISIQYMRRYMLGGLTGLSADDRDGEFLGGKQQERHEFTDEQLNTLNEATMKGVDEFKRVREAMWPEIGYAYRDPENQTLVTAMRLAAIKADKDA